MNLFHGPLHHWLPHMIHFLALRFGHHIIGIEWG